MESTPQYDPLGRYDVMHGVIKVGEVVKGIYYEGPPDYRQEVGNIEIEEGPEGLTLMREDGTIFVLVPQVQS